MGTARQIISTALQLIALEQRYMFDNKHCVTNTKQSITNDNNTCLITSLTLSEKVSSQIGKYASVYEL